MIGAYPCIVLNEILPKTYQHRLVLQPVVHKFGNILLHSSIVCPFGMPVGMGIGDKSRSGTLYAVHPFTQLRTSLKHTNAHFPELCQITSRSQSLGSTSDNHYIKTFIRHVHPPFL